MNPRCARIGSNYTYICVFICWGEGAVSLCGHLLPSSLVIVSLLLLSQRSLSLYPSQLKTEGRTRENLPPWPMLGPRNLVWGGGSNRSMDGITALGYLWRLNHNHRAYIRAGILLTKSNELRPWHQQSCTTTWKCISTFYMNFTHI